MNRSPLLHALGSCLLDLVHTLLVILVIAVCIFVIFTAMPLIVLDYSIRDAMGVGALGVFLYLIIGAPAVTWNRRRRRRVPPPPPPPDPAADQSDYQRRD